MALDTYRSGLVDGIGFVFSKDDPYTGIDLDGCYDPEANVLDPWAQKIITRLNTYTELSPSGTGVHLIIKGQLPGKGRRKGPIEVYSEGRYFTMTGARLDGTPACIADRSAELETLYQGLFADTNAVGPASDTSDNHPSVQDDDDLIERARSARNGAAFSKLWSGDWSGYDSHSEADLALCGMLHFWTSGDTERADGLFRCSGLLRPKWDERHGELTYGEMTLAKAVSGNHQKPPSEPSHDCPEEARSFALTDAGNAEWFAQLYGDDLRYDHARNRWLVWEGHSWAPDADGEIYRRAKEAARERFHSSVKIDDLNLRGKTAEFAVRSESRQKLDACLALAQTEHPIADAGTGWDSSPDLFGVANGVLDLRTGALRPGQRDDRITMRVALEYLPKASCPRWEQFLHQVFQCDAELIAFIQRAVGYSLTGSVLEQVLFLCYGTGANGKSVFLTTLRHLAGDYAMNIPFTVLELQQRANLTNDLAAMAGRRLVTSSETNESTRLNEARIKALTGGDPITARFLYSESFTYDPVAKFWLAVNHLPQVRDCRPSAIMGHIGG